MLTCGENAVISIINDRETNVIISLIVKSWIVIDLRLRSLSWFVFISNYLFSETFNGTVKPCVQAAASMQVRSPVRLIGSAQSQGVAYTYVLRDILQY